MISAHVHSFSRHLLEALAPGNFLGALSSGVEGWSHQCCVGYSNGTYHKWGSGEQTSKSVLCSLGGLQRGAELNLGGYGRDDSSNGVSSPLLPPLPTRNSQSPLGCPQLHFSPLVGKERQPAALLSASPCSWVLFVYLSDYLLLSLTEYIQGL